MPVDRRRQRRELSARDRAWRQRERATNVDRNPDYYARNNHPNFNDFGAPDFADDEGREYRVPTTRNYANVLQGFERLPDTNRATGAGVDAVRAWDGKQLWFKLPKRAPRAERPRGAFGQVADEGAGAPRPWPVVLKSGDRTVRLHPTSNASMAHYGEGTYLSVRVREVVQEPRHRTGSIVLAGAPVAGHV